MGLDKNQCLSLLEMYMKYAPGSLIITNITRRPALVIWDNYAFNMAWPKMEPCFHFLMGWRKIVLTVGLRWLTNYLKAHKAYVYPRVSFTDINRVNFSTPNIEKTSREKSSFMFPPGFKAENPFDVAEVIVIF